MGSIRFICLFVLKLVETGIKLKNKATDLSTSLTMAAILFIRAKPFV